MDYTEIKEPGIYWARLKSAREYNYLVFIGGTIPFCNWYAIYASGEKIDYPPSIKTFDIGPKIEKPTP